MKGKGLRGGRDARSEAERGREIKSPKPTAASVRPESTFPAARGQVSPKVKARVCTPAGTSTAINPSGSVARSGSGAPSSVARQPGK